MNKITIRASFKTESPYPLIWEIYGISTPVRYVTIHYLPVEQNNLLVKVHEDAVKVLKLKKLRRWKKLWKLSKIRGYNRTDAIEFVDVYLPPSWKTVQLRPMIYWFLRYLLDEAWKEL